MHIQREHHDEIADLLRLLARFRWRLGFEHLLLMALRGALASGVALIALSGAAWLTAHPVHDHVWLAAAPLVVALALAIIRWPSHRQAALAADRRLTLHDRLTTAVELVHLGRNGRFDRLQIRDAAAHASVTHEGGWLALDSRARNEAILAAGVLGLAITTFLVVPGWPRPFGVSSPVEPPISDFAIPPDMALRTLPEDATDSTVSKPQPIQPVTPDTSLAARVQQEQSQRAAMDALSRALSSVSASQPAADAVDQGDFSAARNQLQNLGEEADQLSGAAKQQLAGALKAAAAATAQTDPQLAEREKQAAQALSHPTYSDQRQALRDLADQVQKSGDRSVPADQLQRDQGRLQQQTGSATSRQSADAPGSSGSQPATQGPGVGVGSDPNLFANQPAQLDLQGETVQVPLRLNNGPGLRPADGTDDQTTTDLSLGNRLSSEQAQTQQTGQVVPEQNLVPGEQRPVVRGYFR